MTKEFNDPIMTGQLEWMRCHSPTVFITFKKTIQITREKIIIADLEKNFMNRETCPYTVYRVSDEMRKSFSSYLNKPCSGFESFFIVAPDLEYAAMYHLDKQGNICRRRYILQKYQVVDILYTFEGSLLNIKEASGDAYSYDFAKDFEDDGYISNATVLPFNNNREDLPL